MRLTRIPAGSATTAIAAAMMVTMSGTAHAGATVPAAPAIPAAPSPHDVAAARDAANGALPTVGQFFASGGHKPQGDAHQLAAAAAAAAPRIDGATVPVYYLSPAFVADPSASGTATPVAQLSFLATDTISASGTHASVWTADVGSQGWKVVNIASGSDETTYTAQATPGAAVFEEPQIGAWYQVVGGRVLPLNAAARASVGSGVTLADYHQLVRTRYADKMPGSAYDKAGLAGGFQPTVASKNSSTNTAPLTAGVVLIGFGVVGAGAVSWRRSRAQRV
ncbi:conserved hypothetical protein [Catenulispora acidiphila DSM 44928]|uniref:Uncharacterized protein n=1 Tax=Catenulispora acidiphila (strain DSM 44928 / JCM 14897 / NBRC 102108 / NRRL B-24433 / ID139908) TaxID=479433 RepID=C7Q9X2_CATAD|nr:hypothetical protein [Catenulispora acidiphila]ACU76291.1 conserved hypothetical protein [Catenulispora acidiphila DSM 44928]